MMLHVPLVYSQSQKYACGKVEHLLVYTHNYISGEHHHAGELKSRDFDALTSKIRASLAHDEIIRLTDEVLAKAEQVVVSFPVRARDAQHITSALLFQQALLISLPFVTSNHRQLQAVHAHGSTTVLVE
jgi:hypothetical protein